MGLYKLACEHGFPEAHVASAMLSLLRSDIETSRSHFDSATEIYRHRAEGGDVESWELLGDVLRIQHAAIRTPVDEFASAYRTAADHGRATAMCKLASLYCGGIVGYEQKDLDKAMGLYRQAMSLDCADGFMGVADVYLAGYQNSESKTPLDYYVEAGDRGSSEALYRLAMTTEDCVRDHPEAMEIAMEWYNASMDLGNPDAMVALARIYFTGVAGETDSKYAISLLQKACGLNPHSYCLLGDVFDEGRYVERDVWLAEYYYSKAVEAGNGMAVP